MWNIQIEDVQAIDLESTTFCNLHCPECHRETDKVWMEGILNTTHMTKNNIEDWLKLEELTSLKELKFCGAIDEPAANPHLFDILEYINATFVNRDRDFFIDIRTNGSLKTTTWWENLAKLLPRNHRVVFGIDGSDEVSEIYRIGSSFQKVIDNAVAFINAGGIAAWQFIEFKHNQHQIQDAHNKSVELGFRSFSVMSSSRDDQSGEIAHVHLEEDEKPASSANTFNVRVNATQKTTIKIMCENQGLKSDVANGNRILINSLGIVTPCCFLNGFVHMPIAYNKNKSAEDPPFRFEQEPEWDAIWQKHTERGISLHHHTLKEILAGEFFSDIQDSWKSDKPVGRCRDVCGKQVVDVTRFWTKNK